jgi:hypothetical protein
MTSTEPKFSGSDLKKFQRNPPIDDLAIQVVEYINIMLQDIYTLGNVQTCMKEVKENAQFGELWMTPREYRRFRRDRFEMLRLPEAAAKFFALLRGVASRHIFLSRYTFTYTLLIEQFNLSPNNPKSCLKKEEYFSMENINGT